jgi:hypothetical protein
MNPFSFLSQCREAWISSRRLDDRVRSGGSMRIREAWAHERIDAELSDRRGLPRMQPGASLRRDVMLEIQRRRFERRAVADHAGAFNRRLVLAAFTLVVCATAAWQFGPWRHRELLSTAATIEAIEADASDEIDLIGGIALAGRVDEPLRLEVSALGRDTARAASAFFDQLTIEESAIEPAP